MNKISRRQFVAGAFVAGTGLAYGNSSSLAQSGRPYGPFRMGLQSYSLRAFDLDKALDLTERFGVHYWEAFQAHVPQTENPDIISKSLAKFKAAKISCPNWGVESFDGNASRSRKIFEFARSFGFKVITADPSPDSFDILDKLVVEFKIKIGIHNHGPGNRYDTIEKIAAAINNHDPRIGACIDTGHFLRSGIDPVEAVKAFGNRVHSVHLKDVKNKTEFTELGQGDLKLVQFLTELKKVHYSGILALEYEEHEKDPSRYIEICFAAARDAIAKM